MVSIYPSPIRWGLHASHYQYNAKVTKMWSCPPRKYLIVTTNKSLRHDHETWPITQNSLCIKKTQESIFFIDNWDCCVMHLFKNLAHMYIAQVCLSNILQYQYTIIIQYIVHLSLKSKFYYKIISSNFHIFSCQNNGQVNFNIIMMIKSTDIKWTMIGCYQMDYMIIQIN